jgi:hypothetical protein
MQRNFEQSAGEWERGADPSFRPTVAAYFNAIRFQQRHDLSEVRARGIWEILLLIQKV